MSSHPIKGTHDKPIQPGESVTFYWVTNRSVREGLFAKAGMTQKQLHDWQPTPALVMPFRHCNSEISVQPIGSLYTRVITGQFRFTLWLFPRHVTTVYFWVSWASSFLLEWCFYSGEVPGTKSACQEHAVTDIMELLKPLNAVSSS